MRIGLNATCFNDRPSGANQRFIGMYGELIRRSPETEFVIYEPSDCGVAGWFADAANVTARRTSIPSIGRAAKLVHGLGLSLRGFGSDRLDLLEGFNLPFHGLRGGPNVLTIHDTRRLHPDWPALERNLYRMVLARTLARVDRVITVSHTMRREILAFAPDAAVSVVHNGLDPSAFDTVTEDQRRAVREKHRLPEDFVLAVGHLERRKNYLRLIAAAARLRDRGQPVSLVIVGNDSGLRPDIEQAVDAAGLRGSVTILGALSDAEVRALYSLCALFVFPSRYEGFGIPLLEAMAAGRPMAISNIPVFQEITEGRARYFPPGDVEAMADAIEHGLVSTSEREEMVAYGRGRVQDFGFAHLAGEIAALHASVLNDGIASA